MKSLGLIFSLAIAIGCAGVVQAESLRSEEYNRYSNSAYSNSATVADKEQEVVLSKVDERLSGGCPVANFAMTTQIAADGTPGYVWRNTGRLGGWLEAAGRIDIGFKCGDKVFSLKDFSRRSVVRRFPFVRGEYSDKKLWRGAVKMEVFSPLALNDEHTSALPVLMVEFDVENSRSSSERLQIVVSPDFKGKSWVAADDYGIKSDDMSLTCTKALTQCDEGYVITLDIAPKSSERVRIVLSSFDKEWLTANRFRSSTEVADYALRSWERLREQTVLFDKALPQTADKELNDYMRWYMTAGVSLTRLTADGKALTLGYCELNQRDSFWTSWLHLVLFPRLDWQMIEQSYAHISAEGKVPTCIYPIIERRDDLDINLFLLLRTARHYAFYNNRAEVEALWPSMRKVMEWVISRDFSGEGLPEQISFWGDWKDVNYVAERKYSPFVAMLYLASLEQMRLFAEEFGDEKAAEMYAAAYEKGYDKLNRPIAEGGLWNGDYYCQIWKDNSVKDLLYQDQMVGVMYGVVPEERAEQIIKSLNERNASPYGIANSSPFLAGVRDKEAEYHNGGVWPWVCFMDAWARMRAGHSEEGVALIKKVAWADLVRSGDYVPNEHLNSITGANLGFPIQGWNAALFGTVYFNLMHPEARFKIKEQR